jgi:formylglycine-generating enzyme required for sulfatase activity
MWAAKDNGKSVSWHKATKYCRNLRLGGYSDWRLPTIDELEGLVNLRAYTTEHVGYSDILHWNGDLQVNGGLSLTGDRQWSSSPLIDVDGRPSKASFWYFDYRTGRTEKGFEDWAEGDFMQALCVRRSGM